MWHVSDRECKANVTFLSLPHCGWEQCCWTWVFSSCAFLSTWNKPATRSVCDSETLWFIDCWLLSISHFQQRIRKIPALNRSFSYVRQFLNLWVSFLYLTVEVPTRLLPPLWTHSHRSVTSADELTQNTLLNNSGVTDGTGCWQAFAILQALHSPVNH